MSNANRRADENFNRRLRARTALLGALIFILPFGLFLALANSAAERHMRSETFTRLEAGVAANAALLDQVLELRQAEIDALAQRLSSTGSSVWPGILAGFSKSNPWYRTVAVTPAMPPVRDKLMVAAPVGERAVVAVFLSERVRSRLLDLGVGPSEDEFLLDRQGALVSMPRSGRAVPSRPPFRGAAGTAEFRDGQGRAVLAAYRKLRAKDLYLVAQVAAADLVPASDELRRTIILYVSPFLVLGVILATIAWQFAMGSIERLTSEVVSALRVAEQREKERDQAHQELARKFEEERELARQKEQFHAQLAEYEKYAALAQLALGAAHEINNPLLGILSHLELELRAAGSDDSRLEIRQCIEGARRISSTVRGLLNYAKPGPLQLSHVSVDRLITETVAFLCHQPLFRGIRIEKQVAPDLPVITADANQLSQILTNLLLNAAEAMPEGGRITIAADKVKFAEQVAIRISDTGRGIPADVLPHIFEPFFTTKRGKGTGLGLSITQAYLRSHGGDVRVESVPQRGATVEVALPIRQEGRPSPETEEVIA